MSMKNPLTPAGIEPATFRFVAQHLNHCATAVPNHLYCFYISKPGDQIKYLPLKFRCFGIATCNLFFHLADSQEISMQPNTKDV